jgi:general stress protein YciG
MRKFLRLSFQKYFEYFEPTQTRFVGAMTRSAGSHQTSKTKRSIVMAQNQDNKSERGFASMSEEERREIARKGGESVPDEKRSFSQDRELASEAGRKGGESRGHDK